MVIIRRCPMRDPNGIRMLAAVAVAVLLSSAAHAAEDKSAVVTAKLLNAQVAPGGTASVRISLAPVKKVKLYRGEVRVSLAKGTNLELGVVDLPAGEKKYDELLEKQVEYYKQAISFDVPVKVPAKQNPGPLNFSLEVRYQGCTESTCFPPESTRLALELSVSQDAPRLAPPPESPPAVTSSAEDPANVKPSAQPDNWAQRAIEAGGLLGILGAFVAGLFISFTPCVYPMIPVTVALIGGAASSSERKPGRLGLVLYTLVYVLGISITYAVLGVVAASAGKAMSEFMEHWITLSVVGLVMAALSLSMFGAFDLKLPGALTARLGKLQGAGSLPMLLVSGLVMGLVASPCVSAPLAALFITIGKTGNLLVGGLSLFAFGWGMSALLIVAGIFPGLLSRPGAWMGTVKYVFAVVLAAFGLYFARELLPAAMFGWVGLSSAVGAGAVLLLASSRLADAGRARALVKGLGGISLVLSAYLLLGFAYRTGNIEDVLPSSVLPKKATVLAWRDYTPERMNRAAEAGKPVLLYFHSNGCKYCKKLKRETFPDPRIGREAERFELLSANLSRDDQDTAAMAKKLAVRGVPHLVFYGADGTLKQQSAGFLDAEALLAKMRAVR
jgi:thioredoxin:protein disulfide reductase